MIEETVSDIAGTGSETVKYTKTRQTLLILSGSILTLSTLMLIIFIIVNFGKPSSDEGLTSQDWIGFISLGMWFISAMTFSSASNSRNESK